MIPLGQTAGFPIEPSRICLGALSFGAMLSQEQSFILLDRYVELGGNFLDTAHIYAAWIPGGEGASERTIGAWLRARGVRDQIVLATKGAHPAIDAGNEIGRCAPEEIKQDLNESLERLGVEFIDLYWLHRDDPDRPVEDIVETMAGLVQSGRIRAYGGSNWTTQRLQAGNDYAAKQGLPGFTANQPRFSLASAPDTPSGAPPLGEPTEVTLTWHRQQGLPLVAYTSQANGYFGKENVAWTRGGFIGGAPRGGQWDSPGNRTRLQRAMELAAARGVTTNQLALAYLLSQPFSCYPVIGNTSLNRLQEALAVTSLRLTVEEMAALVG